MAAFDGIRNIAGSGASGTLNRLDSAVDTINNDLAPAVDLLTGAVGNLQSTSLAGPGQSIESCLAELVANIVAAVAQNGWSSANPLLPVDRALMLMAEPIDAAANAFLEVSGLDELGSEFNAGDIVSLLAQQLTNPFVAIFLSQLTVLEESADETFKLFYNDPKSAQDSQGLVQDAGGRIRGLIQQLLINPETFIINQGGLLVYGVTETIPALESELSLLRRLKTSIEGTVEQASNLPPSMIPGMPSAAAADLLCQAEQHLKNVKYRLNQERKWDRGEFGQATGNVCDAKTVIFSGKLPDIFSGQLQKLYGLSDLQLNRLKKFTFLPDPRFRLQTIRLVKLNALLQATNVPVLTFHNNLKSFLVDLTGLSGIHLADILGILSEALRRQIGMVRAGLEAEAAGLDLRAELGQSKILSQTNTYKNTFGLTDKPNPVAAAPGISPAAARDEEVNPSGGSIMGYAGTQAGAYITLLALCSLMQKIEQLQSGLQRVLEANDALIGKLKKFVTKYKLEECGPDASSQINSGVEALYKACEERLSGTTKDNTTIFDRYKDLKAAIEQQERFLNCMRDDLNALLSMLTGGLVNTQLIAAVSNIYGIARKIGEADKMLRSLNFGLNLDIKRADYTVWDAIFKSLQCVALQCNNPFLSAQMRALSDDVSSKRVQASAGTVTLGDLNKSAQLAAKAGKNGRVQALLKLIQALQRLTSFNLKDLCAINTEKTTPRVSQGGLASATPNVQALVGLFTPKRTDISAIKPLTVGDRNAAEQSAADQAAGQAGPLDPSNF